jgi:hypothetical protein
VEVVVDFDMMVIDGHQVIAVVCYCYMVIGVLVDDYHDSVMRVEYHDDEYLVVHDFDYVINDDDNDHYDAKMMNYENH